MPTKVENAERDAAAGSGHPPTQADGHDSTPTPEAIRNWFAGDPGAPAEPPGSHHYSFGTELDAALGANHATVIRIIGEMFAEVQHGCKWDYDSLKGRLTWTTDYDAKIPGQERWFHDELPVIIEPTPAQFERAVNDNMALLANEESAGLEWTPEDRETTLRTLHEWRDTVARLIDAVEAQPVYQEPPDDPEETSDRYDDPPIGFDPDVA